MESNYSTENVFDSTTEAFSTLLETSTVSNIAPLTTGQIVYRIVTPAIGVFVILLNSAVMVSSGLILKRYVQPRTTYMFLGNIALCDLLTGVSVVSGSILPKEWRTNLSCCMQLGLIVACTLASAWSVGLVALDRFFYILHGIKYTQWVVTRRVRLLILSTWVFAIVVGFLPAMGWKSAYDGQKCWLVLLAPKPLLAAIVLLGWIPLVMNCVLYLIILYYALNKVIQLKEADKKGSSTVNNMRISRGGSRKNKSNTITVKDDVTSKWKAIKVVAFTTGAYMVTWIPYTTACFLHLICKDPATCKTIANLIAGPLAILLFINSFLNPIIYAWWHIPFRQNVLSLVCKKKPSNNKNSLTTSTTTTSTRSQSGSGFETNLPSQEFTHV